jgi:DNA polymerase-1
MHAVGTRVKARPSRSAQYPGIGAYMAETKSFAQRNGFVETLFGRRCHIKNIHSAGQLGAYAYRQAINAPIQGTAADIIKRAMLRMEQELAREGVRADMLLQASRFTLHCLAPPSPPSPSSPCPHPPHHSPPRRPAQVHDELIFEVDPDHAERAAEVVRRVMETACEPEVHLSVPLVVDVGTAKSWEEAH